MMNLENMKLTKIALVLSLVCLFAPAALAQTNTKKTPAPTTLTKAEIVKASPAYAEVLLRKTELLAELESLLVEYTEEYPKVKDLRFETFLLQRELDRLMATSLPDASKLSAALGKLMVRKCELDTDLWNLQKQFNDTHPDVKRAKRKSEIYEAAINEILQGK